MDINLTPETASVPHQTDWNLDNLDSMSEEDAWQLLNHAFEHGWAAVANLLEMY